MSENEKDTFQEGYYYQKSEETKKADYKAEIKKLKEQSKEQKKFAKAQKAATKKAKKECKKAARMAKSQNKSGGKRILTGIIAGLCFGLFAGSGFLAVTKGKEFFDKHVHFSAQIYDNGKLIDRFGNDPVPEEQAPDAEKNLSEETQETDTSLSPEEESSDEVGEKEISSGEEESVFLRETTDELMTQEEKTMSITDVVKACMPSVVSVSNTYIQEAYFWGQRYAQEAESSGSGIIVGYDEDELLLVTNYHVVANAEELVVTFVDEKNAPAQVRGTDEGKDLAVITVRLSAVSDETLEAIAVATLGDSDQLIVGEQVVAIGNALGYGQSVTAGVVSALNRPLQLGDPGIGNEISTFIQTDAAINPGNSGGALLNMKGEVIGINSSKIGGSAVEGMGYAIPISDAKPIISELMDKETRDRVSVENRGFIGISGMDTTSPNASAYGMPSGVSISFVYEGSGAEKAGLEKGDIIVAINGLEINSMSELKKELEYYAVGDTVTLTIMRGTSDGYVPMDVDVVLGEKQN